MYTAHFMHAVCHLQLTCLLSRKPSVCISVLMDWTASYSQSSYWLRNCCLSSCVHIVVFHCHWFFSPNVRCARQYSAPSYTTSVETTTMTNSSSLNPFYLVSRLKMSTPCTEGLAINFAVKCFLLWPTLIARASTEVRLRLMLKSDQCAQPVQLFWAVFFFAETFPSFVT